MELAVLGIAVAIVLSLLNLLTNRLYRIEDNIIKWIEYYSPQLSKKPIDEIIPILREWKENSNTESKQKTQTIAHLKTYDIAVRDITIIKLMIGFIFILMAVLLIIARR